MENERSTRIREILNIAIQSLEDNLALEITDMFPKWEVGLEMRVGKRI